MNNPNTTGRKTIAVNKRARFEYHIEDRLEAGPLDPEAFLPYADTISGSRWPGENGGPKRG